MAISRERLEELIKNCEIIYGIELNKIESYDLSDEDICISPAGFRDYGLRVFDPLGYWNDIKYENLFETKEDAEWFLEFGNITRTERLDLPNWEEFKNSNETLWFTDMKRNNYAFVCQDNQIVISQKERLNGQVWKATKQNYIKACRIAKKLFMGDERDE